jgi:peptidoglycan hydrolase CwlO-like protein
MGSVGGSSEAAYEQYLEELQQEEQDQEQEQQIQQQKTNSTSTTGSSGDTNSTTGASESSTDYSNMSVSDLNSALTFLDNQAGSLKNKFAKQMIDSSQFNEGMSQINTQITQITNVLNSKKP